METVVLMLNGSPVVKVPVINFQTFATDKIRYLETVIADAGNQRWKFYTYDASELGITESVEKWASWLIYRDLRAVVDGGDQDGTSVHDAVVAADDILDTEYSDALIDYWVSWIKNKQPAGTLSTDRLRTCNAIFPWICVARYNNVVGALVLYHDTKDALSDESERLMYQGEIYERVREMAISYFTQLDREPKDPLQLSDDEFCKKYHAHQDKNLPCYKTKRLPGNA